MILQSTFILGSHVYMCKFLQT